MLRKPHLPLPHSAAGLPNIGDAGPEDCHEGFLWLLKRLPVASDSSTDSEPEKFMDVDTTNPMPKPADGRLA